MQNTSKGSYIQGQFLKSKDPNAEIKSKNPGNLAAPAMLFEVSYEQINDAVSSAQRSFEKWKKTSLNERKNQIVKYKELLAKNSQALAETITFEVGKPLWESQEEVKETLKLIEYFILEADKILLEGKKTVWLPKGVIGVTSPANRPLFYAHHYLIPSILAGNTVVLKSSKVAPQVGQSIAEVFHESGLSAGVFNLVHGDAEVARRLCAQSNIQTVFFSGSFETAVKIQKQMSNEYWKVLVLDLGGKNSTIIWDDANYEKALRETLYSCYVTSGQRWTSCNRIFVHEKIFDKFLSDFHTLAKQLKVDLGSLPEQPFMGPLVSESAQENFIRYQGIAVREGATEVMRGKLLDRNYKGYYVSPSIHYVENANTKSIYETGEIFGPDAAIYKISDLDETISLLNQSVFGLVGAVYTAQKDIVGRLLEDWQVGTLFCNTPTTQIPYWLPLGGIKKSGNSRLLGSHTFYQVTYPKSLCEKEKEEFYLPNSLPSL
jgi:acyl-CoA reductase-like NAD-dependent aldehyde dehydrogenase